MYSHPGAATSAANEGPESTEATKTPPEGGARAAADRAAGALYGTTACRRAGLPGEASASFGDASGAGEPGVTWRLPSGQAAGVLPPRPLLAPSPSATPRTATRIAAAAPA